MTLPEKRKAAGANATPLFLRNWLKNPLRIGAIVPSSRALAAAMARQVPPGEGPVIELGAGTGVVTEALLAAGVKPESLFIIEREPDFHAHLHKRFPHLHVLQGEAGGLGDLLAPYHLPPARAVVSSLPLLSMPAPIRNGIMTAALRCSEPDAPFIQFTYGLGSPIPMTPLGIDGRPVQRIFFNLPPACVWVYHRSQMEKTSQRL